MTHSTEVLLNELFRVVKEELPSIRLESRIWFDCAVQKVEAEDMSFDPADVDWDNVTILLKNKVLDSYGDDAQAKVLFEAVWTSKNTN